jgi:hypothetical protein
MAALYRGPPTPCFPGPEPIRILYAAYWREGEERGLSHPDENVLRSLYDAFSRRDLETVAGLLTDDVVFHQPGRNLRDGKVAELWVQPGDQYAVDEFWS